jgi:hypothetical protein
MGGWEKFLGSIQSDRSALQIAAHSKGVPKMSAGKGGSKLVDSFLRRGVSHVGPSNHQARVDEAQ